jgi:16S rRNA (uracil1498-N3)-methyltransferase
MHHFFVPPEWITPTVVRLQGTVSRQISQVLRLHAGETVMVLDNRGSHYRILLDSVSAQEVVGTIVETARADGEPQTRVTLYIGLTQREKFEWILQKATEVGVACCVPVITQRTLVRGWEEGESHGKKERWERILREAAEQSHRGLIPTLEPVTRLETALRNASQANDACLFAWEGEQQASLRQALQAARPQRIGLFIGPEGGFSAEEAALARQHGAIPVSLGRRILRMETAAVVAAALVLHEMGELG